MRALGPVAYPRFEVVGAVQAKCLKHSPNPQAETSTTRKPYETLNFKLEDKGGSGRRCLELLVP